MTADSTMTTAHGSTQMHSTTGVYIVTVRMLQKHQAHDPKDKKALPCPYSALCTDATGEHHSFLTLGLNAASVWLLWTERARLLDEQGPGEARFRVTRVEEAGWVTP